MSSEWGREMSSPAISTAIAYQHPELILYPSFGQWRGESRRWRIHVAGQLTYLGPANLRRRMLLRVLQRLLDATPDELASPLFQRRIAGFLVGTRRGCQIEVDLGGHLVPLRRRSRRDGHFREAIELSDEDLSRLREASQLVGDRLRYRARESPIGRPSEGTVHLVSGHGLSVISDIDDTIKHSRVMDRRLLLRSTFLEPYSAIPGMAGIYRHWQTQGASFHYVSSSPWQLYPCLEELLRAEGFPAGSFHLCPLRLRDSSLVRWFVARKRTKRRLIRTLLRSFSDRKFILVGDSSERDPEIYGALARRYPERVRRILIRNVPERPYEPERFARAFRGVGRRIWQAFDEAHELIQRV